MRFLPYAFAVCVVLTVLIIGLSHVSAQPSQPTQVGGGSLAGFVYGYTIYNELTPLGWAKISASNSLYNFTFSTSSFDGSYQMYLPEGTFNVTASSPGFTPYSQTVAISNGASYTGFNFYLEQSHVPVPEFPQAAVTAIMILAVAATLIAKRATRRKN